MMKKISLILLVAALLFVFMSTSLAAVSYDAESKTVTITSEDTGFVEVWINGRNYGTMTGGSKTISVASLADGKYTVSLVGDTADGPAGSFTIGTPATEAPATEAPATEAPATAAPATEAPADPTSAPFTPEEGKLEITAEYTVGRVNYTVSGLSSYGELWLDGKTVKSLSGNGSGSIAAELPEGTHTLLVLNADTGVSKTATFKVEYKAPVINGVSYDKEGKLFFTVSNITNRCEVWVDGASLGTYVSADGTYPLNKALTHGSHTLLILNSDTGKSTSASFTAHTYEKIAAVDPTCEKDGSTAGIKCSEGDSELVKPEIIPALGHEAKVVEGKAATCTETGLTDGEVCARCEKVLKAQEVIPVIDHTPKAVEGKAATCTEKGLTEGSVCAVCGKELKAPEEIPALGHDYKVVDKSNGRIYYKCSRCGDTFNEKDPNYVAPKNNKNTYGTILKDTNNVFVDYTADGNGKILVIKADLSKEYTSEIGMYLDADLIAQIQKEGYTAIEYINGEADIVIELDGIASTWFDTNSAIWCYVFSTDPAAAEGTLVKVEAQISGIDKVPATAFSGVTLKKGNETIAITENGNY